MEIINDTPFAVEAMPFDFGPEGKPILTVIVKGTFSINSDGTAGVAEKQIPVLFGDELYEDKEGSVVKFETDVVPFKPRADIVLVGCAHAPGERPVTAMDVALRVGDVRKVIRVFGDRKWIFGGDLMPAVMSKPASFVSMDLTYDRAFGGVDLSGGEFCAENLVGRGLVGKKAEKPRGDILLPNLEDPKNLIKSWKDRPKPVGFGFYGRAWMPRMQYLGTYDERWRKERSPDPPEDFRFDCYNAAPPDQQIDGYLKGDEEVELINLSKVGRVTFRLPGVTPSVTLMKTNRFESGVDEEELTEEELAVSLDTLCLIPDEGRFYMVWRGINQIEDLASLEVNSVEIHIPEAV